jgi:hypothetical protein
MKTRTIHTITGRVVVELHNPSHGQGYGAPRLPAPAPAPPGRVFRAGEEPDFGALERRAMAESILSHGFSIDAVPEKLRPVAQAMHDDWKARNPEAAKRIDRKKR